MTVARLWIIFENYCKENEIPTENELKYLLNLECEADLIAVAINVRHIHQGYLAFTKGMSLRVRETNGNRYELTFKQKIKNRVVEIEKKIDLRDYTDLWDIAVNKLEKIRYDIKDDAKGLWEVDVFKDHFHKSYIIIAEHEMPEGMETPKIIPKIIKKNLLYAVPKNDVRFASKKIANLKYAQKLYQILKDQNE